MSVRSRRAARILAAMEFAQELAEYTRQAHEGATFHIDRAELELQWYATGVSRTRDSDPLEESNWQVVSEDLQERFPESFDVHHFGHWACGWYDRLYVRADDAFAIRALQEWSDALSDYPIANEEHYSALEDDRNHPSERECYADDDCGCDYNQHQQNLDEQHAEYAAQNPEEIDADFTYWCETCGEWVDVPPSGISRYFNETRQALSWGTLYYRERWINGKKYRFIRQTANDGRTAVGCRVQGEDGTVIRSAPLHMWASFSKVTVR